MGIVMLKPFTARGYIHALLVEEKEQKEEEYDAIRLKGDKKQLTNKEIRNSLFCVCLINF